MGRIAPHLTTGWIDQLQALNIYLALVSSDPLAATDPLTVEIVGGTYARQPATVTRTGPGALTITSATTWSGIPAGANLAGVAGFDAAFNGNLLFADMLTTGVSFTSGGSWTLASGQLVVGIDLPTG